MSKSEAIRQMIRSNPNMGANDCVKALKKQGITINESLFYNARSSMQACKTCHKQSCIRTINNELSTVETIRELKKCAKLVGGIKKMADLLSAMQ